jgi:predicted PurR-regulated permease PerM
MNNFILKYLKENHFLTTVLFLMACYFIFLVRDILILVFIAFIIVATLSPLVEFLEGKKIPKIISVFVSYLIFIGIILSIVLPVIPFFTSQIQLLFKSFPQYIDQVTDILKLPFSSSQINSLLTSEAKVIGDNAFNVTSKFFGGVISTIAVFAVSFYTLLDKERIKNGIVSLFSKSWQKKAGTIMHVVEKNLGSWFRGEIVLCVTIGALTWVILTLLGLRFAFPLAIIAGLLEIIPTIGPIISAIPAIIVALTISPIMAIVVALAYEAIHTLENHVVVPNVMKKAVGLNPVIIILAVITGGRLMGVIGALLAIPFVSTLTVILKELRASD